MAQRLRAEIKAPYSSAYGASKAIDGSLRTSCLSRSRPANWLSVEVAAGTPIGYVAIRNAHVSRWQPWLGNVEIWLGTSMGDSSSASAVKCGETSYDRANRGQSYVLWCGGVSDRPFVTVKRAGTRSGYLAVAELEPYVVG